MALILDGSQQLSLKTPPYVIPTGLSVVFCVQPERESSSYYVLGDYRDSSNAAGKSLGLYGTAYGQGNRPYYPGGSSKLGSENYTSSFPQVPQLISYSWTPVGGNSHHTARASAVFANNVFQSINGHVWSTNWAANFINNQNKLYLFDKYAGSGTALRGKVFWVALVNEFWDNTRSKDIHEALLRQDTHIFDDYQHSLIELWDFNDGQNALLGRIGGTPLSIEKGTLSYQPSNVPVSRNTFIGIGQPNISDAPAWFSTLTNDDGTTIGTCTSTSTVMANGIGSDGSEPEGWEPVKISNGAESSSGFNHYTIDNTNNMDMLLWVYYVPKSGSLPDGFEISAKINTLPITLTKTSITTSTEGWLTFEIPPEVKEVDVHGRITQLKYFYTTHLTKDSKDITYDKEWQTVMDLTVSNGGTETATAAINGTSSLVGISIYHATEPTTPCVVYIETSTDSGSTYTPYKATYGVINAAYTVTDMIRLPAGTTNVKAIATGNTGLSATVKVIVGVIKGMKEVV